MAGQQLLSDRETRSQRAFGGDTDFGALTRLVVCELAPVFSPAFGDGFVTGEVRRAITELRGSVSAESLPEMVARLACHRMTARLSS